MKETLYETARRSRSKMERGRRKRGKGGEGIEEIERWEVEKAIRRLKNEKTREDGIENKVWKYGEKGIKNMGSL